MVCVRRAGGGPGHQIEAMLQAVPEDRGQVELHNVRQNQCTLMHRILWAKKLIRTMVQLVLHVEISANISRRSSALVRSQHASELARALSVLLVCRLSCGQKLCMLA